MARGDILNTPLSTRATNPQQYVSSPSLNSTPGAVGGVLSNTPAAIKSFTSGGLKNSTSIFSKDAQGGDGGIASLGSANSPSSKPASGFLNAPATTAVGNTLAKNSSLLGSLLDQSHTAAVGASATSTPMFNLSSKLGGEKKNDSASINGIFSQSPANASGIPTPSMFAATSKPAGFEVDKITTSSGFSFAKDSGNSLQNKAKDKSGFTDGLVSK